jgi:tetratricopeptide (TPR) repeat protein
MLATAMLVVYGATLNPWLSQLNLDYVARLSGWIWSPDVVRPLTWLATLPLGWLPTGVIPGALNFFAAVCAALTLGLLARSVALLPQDRTEAQRLREISDFSFLTARGAWLPPVLAVLAGGLQFSFWENATNFTGEALDLLVFAFTVWSLLEYRLDEREERLMLAVFIYGAGMTEDIALVGFLPLLVVALVWIRGLSFFNAGFLGRIALCGLAGTSLYLLLPTVGLISGKIPTALWWPAVKYNLAPQWHAVRGFFTSGGYRYHLGLLSLTTLLPAFLPVLRWRVFGDRSRMGNEITSLLFHTVHGVLFGICLWGAFDPPFGARHLESRFPFLPLYYLAALSVGYYSGYFIVVSKALPPRRKKKRRSPSIFKRWLNPGVRTTLATLAVLTAAGLLYKNLPAIQNTNSGVLRKYAELTAASLPHTGGVLLSDTETGDQGSRRLLLVQEALVQAGRGNEYVPVDTWALQYPGYHRHLHQRYPEKWPLVVNARAENLLDPHGLLGLLEMLAKTNDLYYLHPSFGYYFEVFYPEPHGLIYKLKPLPGDTHLPPLPDAALQAENDAFWARTEAAEFAPIFREEAPVNPAAKRPGLPERIMARLHITREPDFNAKLAGLYYSRGLDFWGVQEQRAHDLKAAAAHFATAQKLNPNNQVAAINLEFNQRLQAGLPVAVDLARTTTEQFVKYHSWDDILTVNGPFDDPSFCYQDGMIRLQETYLHQAIADFSRVRQLVPDHLPTLLSLAELYDFDHQPERTLEVLREPLTHPARFSLDAHNSTELNLTAAAAYIQQTNLSRGVRLIEQEIAQHPDNTNLLTTAVQVYLTQGLLTNALRVIKLKLDQTPDDPVWLYGEGFTCLRMEDYAGAIASMTRVLALQTNNYDALFNRALAGLNSGRLAAARTDYLQLQKTFPKAFRVAYGLGDIAWREHDTNAAILNYTLCLDNAPTNLAEATLIQERLAELRHPAP